MTNFISLWQAAVTFGTVILFGALGELVTEKSGNLNLGTPGIMYLGGIASLVGAFFYENSVANPNAVVGILVSLLCAIAASALGGLLFSFLTITLRTNQNVTGLTLTILSSGIANFFGGSLNKLAGGVGQISVATTSAGFRTVTPLSGAGTVGKLLFSYGFLTYTAVVLAILVSLFLNRTRTGLNLRAVGESPATADATGINVTAYKYIATCVGSAITGLGGVFYTMNYIKGTWANDGTIEGLGWLALALVIFASWKSLNVIWGSFLFGILYWLYFYIGGLTRYSQELFKMIPYIVTILVLVITSMRKKKENMGPAALGLSYFREER
jgi:simple sugar transport system permease protein